MLLPRLSPLAAAALLAGSMLAVATPAFADVGAEKETTLLALAERADRIVAGAISAALDENGALRVTVAAEVKPGVVGGADVRVAPPEVGVNPVAKPGQRGDTTAVIALSGVGGGWSVRGWERGIITNEEADPASIRNALTGYLGIIRSQSDPASRDETLATLLVSHLGSPVERIHRDAALSLADPRFVRFLAARVDTLAELFAVHPGDALFRMRLCDLLGAVGGEPALAALLAVARGEDDPSVLRAAAAAAKSIDPKKTLESAQAGVLAAKESATKARALCFLGWQRDARGVPQAAMLAADPDPVVKAVAVEALGRIGDVTAVPTLLRVLDAPADPADAAHKVREKTVLALGTIGGEQARARLTAMASAESDPARQEFIRLARDYPHTVSVD
ncbi:MAG: HEAT repeat domain-containing protein [Planctomycetes bacterium]|nr:HEAT repeat domain-containing protein [Planctomycetota bacterium]